MKYSIILLMIFLITALLMQLPKHASSAAHNNEHVLGKQTKKCISPSGKKQGGNKKHVVDNCK